MCIACIAAVEKYFPGISVSERNNLLWGATSFPFGHGSDIATQLAEKRQQIDDLKQIPGFWPRFDFQGLPLSDVEIALDIADAEITACMKTR